MAPETLEVFFSYAREDEALRNELATHLSLMKRQKIIKMWHDRDLAAGTEWEPELLAHLDAARVILLLISNNFLTSDYSYDIELERAMERHKRGEARVIPIILKPCDWHDAPFGGLQALPRNAKPVTTWDNQDEAFLDVAKGIRKAVQQLLDQSA